MKASSVSQKSLATLQERLMLTNAKAAQLYLQRQRIEEDRQKITREAMQCEHALIHTDGQIQMLTAMIAEEQKATDGQ